MGLGLAHRLVKHGQRVTLFEARPSLGGLADACLQSVLVG